MPLPTPPEAPPVPSRTQDDPTFNDNIIAFLAFVVSFIAFIKNWNTALAGEVDSRISAAVAAYDPNGAYSAAQIDAKLAELEARTFFLTSTM
jgi:hypothetical protein